MASRATRYLTPVFRSGPKPSRTAFRTSGRRGMASTASPSTHSSDLPWIIGSGLVFVPTVAWILSSGKGEKHAHAAPKATKEHAPEPVSAEPTPEPVPEEEPAEATPEPGATESAVSDDDGVVISKEELEESINAAVDADIPKEAKTVETTETSSSEPASTPSESKSVTDGEVAAPSKEEISPPPADEDTATDRK